MKKGNKMEYSKKEIRADSEENRTSNRKKKEKNAVLDLGSNYERVPHPTLKRTFILKEVPRDKEE